MYENWQWVLACIFMLIMGIYTGYVIAKGKFNRNPKDDGVLFVDLSDPVSPYLSMGLSNEQLQHICETQNTITFMVVHVDKPIS